MQFVRSLAIAFLLAFSGLLVSLGASWIVMNQLNYSYSFWHDYKGMAEAITRLARTNIYKSGFELTTKEQRTQLFREIMDSVHDGGRGLEQITFNVPGHPEQVLLVESEVIHLTDVAHLVQKGMVLAAVALIVWLGAWAYFMWSKRAPPTLRLQLLSISIFTALLAAVVFAVGPLEVFYALHVWMFPDGHQWFFYFKESLMATMMYAPTFFGWVAIEWFAITFALFFVLQTGIAYWVRRFV